MVHWATIETGLSATGAPDSNGCHQGVDFWVENKRTTGWRVEVRPVQIGWAHQRIRHGGRVIYAVYQDRELRRGREQAIWIFSGRMASRLGELGVMPLQMEAMHMSSGEPRDWDWSAILECYTTREL